MNYPIWCKRSFSYLWVVVNGKRFKILASVASITTLILILNCGGSGGGTQPSNGALEVELVLGGLDFPVTLACTSDGRIFFNELRTGNIRIIREGVLFPTPFATVPVSINGENGLIGLAFHPRFDSNGFVYVFHTHPHPRRNRVLRFTDLNNLGTQETVIIDDLPAADIHIGGNLGFGPDGKLYVTIGDVSNPANSQSLDSLAGKILRYNPDGTIPADNPFLDSPIFALGLRNSFDFTFHPATGVIYATENGPNCDDEINRIIAGGNYGWRPNYPCGDTDTEFISPIIRFSPPIVPTGITFYTGDQYPEFLNDLFFVYFDGGTEGKIKRIELTGENLDQAGSISSFLVEGELGGLLDVITCPDGNLYFSSADSIFRVVKKP